MALRRQGLSQRRKAVGFTQESLAEHLGVERSTIVRWETGDTEPLPSIRPKVARALQVSTDQLAELLTEPEPADTARALPADTEVTIPLLLPEVQPEVRPGRTEFEDLIRPQVADTAEALRRALRSAGVVPEDLGAMLLFGGSSRVSPVSAELGRPVAVDAKAGSDAAEPAQTDVGQRPTLTAIPARSRRFNRFAAAGALALAFAAGAVSVPFITSYSGPILPAATGTPAPATPVAAIPAPNPGHSKDNTSRKDSTGAVHTAPAAAPNESAGSPAPPPAAAVPAPHTIRSHNRTIRRSKPRVSTTAPALPRIPAIPAEAYAWYQTAMLSAR
ncbi:MAG: helix-turn-helix domain-containing protein [Pseudonocardiaceae bacterium]